MTSPNDFTWLREELRKPGRSQTALAQHMGLHVSAVNKILNGTRSVKVPEYNMIMNYLNIDPEVGFREYVRHRERLVTNELTLIDVDWVLNRAAQFPPGIAENIDKLLLAALAEDDEYSLIAKCFHCAFDELKKSLILFMKSFNDRYASTLSDFLRDDDLTITLARGLSLINEDDARRLKALSSAFSQSLRPIAGETAGQYRENLRRAAGAGTLDADDRVKAKLVKGVTELFEQLVQAQRVRIHMAERFLGVQAAPPGSAKKPNEKRQPKIENAD